MKSYIQIVIAENTPAYALFFFVISDDDEENDMVFSSQSVHNSNAINKSFLLSWTLQIFIELESLYSFLTLVKLQ